MPAEPAESTCDFPRIGLEVARELCRAVVVDAEAPSLACAVVDPSGNVIALERTARTSFLTASIALAKARTSVLLGRPTSLTAGRASEAAELYRVLADLSGGPMLHVAGGLPIGDGRTIIGGLGVSGGSPEDDERLGLAALERVGLA